MKRRKFLFALPALCTPWVRAETLQSSRNVVRVGILATTTEARHHAQEKVFTGAMRELGWSEGRNIIYDRVYADDKEARLPALAAELVARSPRLIHVVETQPALAALAATRTIPIVFAAASDPVERGLVPDMARPRGNVTGIAHYGWQLGRARLFLVKQVFPNIARAGVLVDPLSPNSVREQKIIEQRGARHDVLVTPAPVRQASDLDAAFGFLSKNGVEAVLTTDTMLFSNLRKYLVGLATARQMPVVAHRGEFADDGALMAYSSNLSDQVRRSAQIVDKVLKGAKPADLPVELPSKFELVVNRKTAKMLGIIIPREVMQRATRVIS